MRLFLIEDDEETREYVRAALSTRGHLVETATSGKVGLEAASTGSYDVLIVDRLLPDLDGLSIVKALRTAQVTTPAIILTALGGIADRVEGLRGGCDDYLVKPFDMDELEARIEALGRRPDISANSISLHRCGIVLDRLTRTAVYGDEVLDLTSSEYAMLELLILNAGRVVTKAMILETVFDLDARAARHLVEPHMSRLRGKLERAGLVAPIRTIRGTGYAFA